ncbi:MAG: acetolactate decarboxylase, partial [Actinomycetales bacterium]|nr:acetolactate decarboxylase [Actinomycetales bacterium]
GLHLHAIARDHDSGGHCHELTVHQAHVQVWIDDVEVDVPGLPATA